MSDCFGPASCIFADRRIYRLTQVSKQMSHLTEKVLEKKQNKSGHSGKLRQCRPEGEGQQRQLGIILYAQILFIFSLLNNDASPISVCDLLYYLFSECTKRPLSFHQSKCS